MPQLPSFATPNPAVYLLERVMGVEPTLPAWKAGVLPLNYTRIMGVEIIIM